MQSISELFDWITVHEALLSGLAAALAIAAVAVALISRPLGWFRRKPASQPDADGKAASRSPQEIRYCRSKDGISIGWASVGEGVPLVRVHGWFTNLEMEWQAPASARLWQALADRFRLIRYDGRGMGVSEREIDEFSAETRLADLEAVIDAAGLERFALLGISEGGSTAIRYAHKYPERVSHLVLWGAFLAGPKVGDVPELGAIARLAPRHWGREDSPFHQMFTGLFLPDGNADENLLFNEMQRTSCSVETAVKFMKVVSDVDVREIAGKVTTPTLVLHRKGDLVIPLRYGRDIAACMPNARLVTLEGRNHWVVASDDVQQVSRTISEFLEE